jgi:hypothetical protein
MLILDWDLEYHHSGESGENGENSTFANDKLETRLILFYKATCVYPWDFQFRLKIQRNSRDITLQTLRKEIDMLDTTN